MVGQFFAFRWKPFLLLYVYLAILLSLVLWLGDLVSHLAVLSSLTQRILK